MESHWFKMAAILQLFAEITKEFF